MKSSGVHKRLQVLVTIIINNSLLYFTSDVVTYLPKLAVVLQPVQEYWEQLGLQLNIDQSVLTDIRSKGDSTEQMKYLLEEWSLKGGTLTQLEDALLHLDMKYVIPGKSCSTDTYVQALCHFINLSSHHGTIIAIYYFWYIFYL